MRERLAGSWLALMLVPLAAAAQPPSPPPPEVVVERVGFQQAVRLALERHPSVAEAEQAIRRVQALLDQARSVFRPTLYGTVDTTVLDAARGFDGNITQPRTQTGLSGTVSYNVLAASRWAAARQARDQVDIARVSAEEIRRQVALSAAIAYLTVLATDHQRDIAIRNRETALALADYAQTRLEAGQGSRLNQVRAFLELATAEGLVQSADLAVQQSREALGLAIFARGPVAAEGEADIPLPAPGDEEAWLAKRPDMRLFTAQAEAAERVVRDTWKSWLPFATARFTPKHVSPAGFFEPANTWRAVVELTVPVYDGTLGATKRLRVAEQEAARLRLELVRTEARSEVRFAREAVARNEEIVASTREAAEGAREALRITEIAYRAGATTNVEVVQAQQTARNAESQAALAEDRLRQARLDLLVALGQFP